MRARLALFAATALALSTTSRTEAATALDCFDKLMRGRGEIIACTLPLMPNAQERAELEKQSYGYVKDAQCTVTIRIARADVMAAVTDGDHVFQAPPQPVQCIVTGQWGKEMKTVPIAATFAPRVVVRAGRAVDAVPGLANVQGVQRALSWPVETAVNSGIGFKQNTLVVINAWLDHMRQTRGRPATRQQAWR